MRRLSIVLLAAAILGACAGDPPADEPAAEEPEATSSAPALPGARAIDRARGAADAANARALQHDTIR